MPEVAAPPEVGFDDFLDDAIGTDLEKEQSETLSAKFAPTKVEPPAPETPAKEAPVAKEPVKAPEAKPTDTDWKDALEFSKDLEKAPTAPKATTEKYPEKPPGATTEKASAAWATLRHRASQADQMEVRAKELEAKVQELEAKTANLADQEIVPKELWAKTKKDQEELVGTLKLTNLEATPEFKQLITVPVQQIKESAKVLADRYNVSYRDVLNALEEPDESKQADMLSELVENGQFKEKNKLDLFRYGDQMRDLQFKRGQLTQNVAKTLEIIEHQRRMQAENQQKAQAEQWEQALNRSWQTLEKGIWVFQKSDTDQEWNQSLDALRTTVKNVNYQDMPMEKQAQILYQAAVVPRLLKALQEAKTIIVSKDEALSKYSSSTPGAGAGEGTGEPAPLNPADDSLGFVDAMLR